VSNLLHIKIAARTLCITRSVAKADVGSDARPFQDARRRGSDDRIARVAPVRGRRE
jgi:hypothetical protein